MDAANMFFKKRPFLSAIAASTMTLLGTGSYIIWNIKKEEREEAAVIRKEERMVAASIAKEEREEAAAIRKEKRMEEEAIRKGEKMVAASIEKENRELSRARELFAEEVANLCKNKNIPRHKCLETIQELFQFIDQVKVDNSI